ncbi:MAG: hypothetical protein V5A47_05760 [Bacteroidales bacterium]|nr:hypothetical protein [Bacteroidales bacterium]MBS3775039.1 hypothetical protein [Bacteroidales bacterium]
MALYLKLIVLVIVLVAIVMGVFGLKLLYDKGAKFNVDSDPDKYEKIKKDGMYSAYSKQNKSEQNREKDT